MNHSTKPKQKLLNSLTSSLIVIGTAIASGCATAPTGDEASQLIEVDGETWRATEIARETFSNDSWRNRWTLEGNATIEAEDGRLNVATKQEPNVDKVATLWWHEPLPANVMIELDSGVAPVEGDMNAANLNMFIHARELNGSPYRVGRSGKYSEYHKIPNYIITLTGGFQPGWSRMRRDPGFNIISEDKSTRSAAGETYRMRVVIADGHLRYWLNDRLIHDAYDPNPLPGGHFGLRTWRSLVWWSDIRFSELTPAGDSR